jgi:hypothetical protein
MPDPCLTNNGGCDHTCETKRNGQKVCSCHSGLVLAEDGLGCVYPAQCSAVTFPPNSEGASSTLVGHTGAPACTPGLQLWNGGQGYITQCAMQCQAGYVDHPRRRGLTSTCPETVYINANGQHCMRTPNRNAVPYEGYGTNVQCEYYLDHVMSATIASVSWDGLEPYFWDASCWDYLQIGQDQYCDSGPSVGTQIEPGQQISFYADGWDDITWHEGYDLCLDLQLGNPHSVAYCPLNVTNGSAPVLDLDCAEITCAAYNFGPGVVAGDSDPCQSGVNLTVLADNTCNIKCDTSLYQAQSTTLTCANDATSQGRLPSGAADFQCERIRCAPYVFAEGVTGTCKNGTALGSGESCELSCGLGYTGPNTTVSCAAGVGHGAPVTGGATSCQKTVCAPYNFPPGVVGFDGPNACTDGIEQPNHRPPCGLQCAAGYVPWDSQYYSLPSCSSTYQGAAMYQSFPDPVSGVMGCTEVILGVGGSIKAIDMEYTQGACDEMVFDPGFVNSSYVVTLGEFDHSAGLYDHYFSTMSASVTQYLASGSLTSSLCPASGGSWPNYERASMVTLMFEPSSSLTSIAAGTIISVTEPSTCVYEIAVSVPPCSGIPSPVHGSCDNTVEMVNATYACITSPNFDTVTDYTPNQDCSYYFNREVVIDSIHHFDLEDMSSCSWDYLQIGDDRYCGFYGWNGYPSNGPQPQVGMVIDPETEVEFSSDFSVQNTGFRMCVTTTGAPPREPLYCPNGASMGDPAETELNCRPASHTASPTVAPSASGSPTASLPIGVSPSNSAAGTPSNSAAGTPSSVAVAPSPPPQSQILSSVVALNGMSLFDWTNPIVAGSSSTGESTFKTALATEAAVSLDKVTINSATESSRKQSTLNVAYQIETTNDPATLAQLLNNSAVIAGAYNTQLSAAGWPGTAIGVVVLVSPSITSTPPASTPAPDDDTSGGGGGGGGSGGTAIGIGAGVGGAAVLTMIGAAVVFGKKKKRKAELDIEAGPERNSMGSMAPVRAPPTVASSATGLTGLTGLALTTNTPTKELWPTDEAGGESTYVAQVAEGEGDDEVSHDAESIGRTSSFEGKKLHKNMNAERQRKEELIQKLRRNSMEKLQKPEGTEDSVADLAL